jgi:hypothetical protein
MSFEIGDKVTIVEIVPYYDKTSPVLTKCIGLEGVIVGLGVPKLYRVQFTNKAGYTVFWEAELKKVEPPALKFKVGDRVVSTKAKERIGTILCIDLNPTGICKEMGWVYEVRWEWVSTVRPASTANYAEHELTLYVPPAPKPKFGVGDRVRCTNHVLSRRVGSITKVGSSNLYEVVWDDSNYCPIYYAEKDLALVEFGIGYRVFLNNNWGITGTIIKVRVNIPTSNYFVVRWDSGSNLCVGYSDSQLGLVSAAKIVED